MKLLDLENPTHTYIFGFIQADGSVEYKELVLKYIEKINYFLNTLKKELCCNGIISNRKTRETCCLYLSSKQFVENIIKQGIPAGKKSSIISTPDKLLLSPDYWRGIGRPFIGLTTSSRNLAESFLYFANKILDKNLKKI